MELCSSEYKKRDADINRHPFFDIVYMGRVSSSRLQQLPALRKSPEKVAVEREPAGTYGRGRYGLSEDLRGES
jgi:hypothetical protein